MNGLVTTIEEDEMFMCMPALLCEQFLVPIREVPRDQVLLHEFIFFSEFIQQQ